MQTCSKCLQSLPKEQFGVCKKNKTGLKEVCKSCRREEARVYYIRKDKQRHILESLKNRAKTKGLEFNLEYSDLTPPSHCPVFGVALTRIEPHSKQSKLFSMSVDRINPEKGYVKGNIQIISQLANVMKHDATPEELLMFADWVIRTYRKGNI